MKYWLMGLYLLVTYVVAVAGKAPVLGMLGQEVTLPCVDEEVGRTDWESLLVSWQRDKEVVHAQNGRGEQEVEQQRRYANRTAMDEQAFGRGDYSLRLAGLRRADEGLYKCILLRDIKLQEREVMLVTAANYSRPVIEGPGSEPTAEGRTVNLTCLSWGGYPEPRVSWTDGEGRPLPNASQVDQPRADPFSGLWNVSSRIHVKPTPNSSYICSVLNPRTKERRSSAPWHGFWEVDAKPRQRNKTFSFVTGAVMACGTLVALGTLYLTKRKRPHHPEMHTGHSEEQQPIALNRVMTGQSPC